ncbi:MAG TPA: hypothetical protein ENK65_00525 [Helicobacteraceae bacterium]|nr:hypothetical protein [Helicobacteraceae bacterium]
MILSSKTFSSSSDNTISGTLNGSSSERTASFLASGSCKSATMTTNLLISNDRIFLASSNVEQTSTPNCNSFAILSVN